ncbi:MAG: hypothetical protein SFY32_14785 [Bacteroidota bacterium]|nr:hypothetical protein [Bacteroidota bacterium]
MKYAELVTHNYPIVIINLNPIDPTSQEIEDFFNELEVFMDSTTGPYVFVSYNKEFKYLSSQARLEIGTRANKLNKKYAGRKLADIVVINGLLSGLVLKSLTVIYKPLKDAIIFSTLEEGIQKAKEILSNHNS